MKKIIDHINKRNKCRNFNKRFNLPWNNNLNLLQRIKNYFNNK